MLLVGGQTTQVAAQSASSATVTAPNLLGLSKPVAGDTQILFRGKNGPFRLQSRTSLDANATWFDLVGAKITTLQNDLYLASFPMGREDVAYYRVVNENETIAELKGWSAMMQVSAPANKSFFVAGERPVITITILDTFALGVTRNELSTMNLYMSGPKEPKLTVTALKLLNATGDRTKTPHHFINLKTNPDVQVNGNVLTYTLQPVTDELPGTYTINLRAVLGTDALQQIMKSAEVQIGTATVETSVYKLPDQKTTCAKCHEGTVSGKMYFAHIDPGSTGVGSWSYDFQPESNCAACHNNDGYASFRDFYTNTVRIPDQLVRRVHGVHMGDELTSEANTNQTSGVFRAYTHGAFPVDIRNCTTCHVDDRWKTMPSQVACGSCHDNIWFGSKTAVPGTMEKHSGGERSDATCTTCHSAEDIAGYHVVPAQVMDQVDITMTPPANGKFYAAGDKPIITVVIKNDATNAIDHAQVTDVNFSTASLFVYGPRAEAKPVLTSSAKNGVSKLWASVTSSKAGPWDIKGKTFKVAINGSAAQEITMTSSSNTVSAADVVAALNAVITNTNLNGGAKAAVSGSNVNIKSQVQGTGGKIEIYNGDVTTAMGWKRSPNTTMEPDVTVASSTTSGNDLRSVADTTVYADPMVTRTAANITYQLDDVAGLASGTYNIYMYHVPKAGKVAGMAATTGIGHLTFQVGTTNIEAKIATNCKDCHGETIFHFTGNIHAEPFDTDYCNACHDYGRYGTGEAFKNQGGTSLAGWSGYGAMPIINRVHGIHYGRYLAHPEEIYANATVDTFGHMIFPQDVRNCTKCHAQSDSWKKKPSRIACLACHDEDDAKAHGKLMTYMPDPSDPYGPKSVETCDICHGADADLSVEKVHSISKPYVPPYRREPSE